MKSPERFFPVGFLRKVTSSLTLSSVFAFSAAVGTSSAITATEKPFVRETGTSVLQEPLLFAQTDGTLVSYRTAEYSVRIFRRGGQTLMNVYDNSEEALRLDAAPATFTYRNRTPVYISTGEFRDRQAEYVTELFENRFARLLILDSNDGLIVEEDATEILAFTVPDGIFNNAIRDTILSFETVTYAVRVFERNGQRLMNVYNNFTGEALVNGKAASFVSPAPPFENSASYVASGTLGGQPVEFFARISGDGRTLLEIYNVNGQRLFQEPSTGPIVVNIPPDELPPGVEIERVSDAYVAAVFGGQETLQRIQTLFPEAFLDRSARQGDFINAGSFPSLSEAQRRVLDLQSAGFGNARVVFRDVRYR